jgi:glutaminase
VEPAAVELLAGLLDRLAMEDVEVIISGGAQLDVLVEGRAHVRRAIDLDAALEIAEERLLAGADVHVAHTIAFGDQSFVAGLSPGGLAAVASRVQRRTFAAGSTVVTRGDSSTELFLIESGQANVTIGLEGGGRRRLSTMGPGMSFGEAALLDGGLRSADVVADTDLVCLVLSVSGFEDILAEHPAVAVTLLRNLLRTVGATAGRLTREVAVLAS